MNGHGSQLRYKIDAAVAAVLSQRTIGDAASEVGVSPKTLRRWLKLPKFKTACLRARREAFSQALARLQQSAGAAVATLLRIMVDPSAPYPCRVRAAAYVLNLGAKALELEDWEDRIAELERVAQSVQLDKAA